MRTDMRTGDSCYHAPTGETWLVAFADEERNELVPCGWPLTLAKLSDCTLVEACTDQEHEALLDRLLHMSDQTDMRCRWAHRHMQQHPRTTHPLPPVDKE